MTFTNICAACEPIQMVTNAEFNVLQVRQVNQCPRCLQSKLVVLWGACPCVPRQVTYLAVGPHFPLPSLIWGLVWMRVGLGGRTKKEVEVF